jgi:hypothetical protein
VLNGSKPFSPSSGKLEKLDLLPRRSLPPSNHGPVRMDAEFVALCLFINVYYSSLCIVYMTLAH